MLCLAISMPMGKPAPHRALPSCIHCRGPSRTANDKIHLIVFCPSNGDKGYTLIGYIFRPLGFRPGVSYKLLGYPRRNRQRHPSCRAEPLHEAASLLLFGSYAGIGAGEDGGGVVVVEVVDVDGDDVRVHVLTSLYI